MTRIALAATALLLAAPATAQTAQDQLDARYDRALAAGYKALMLCGAIGGAERSGFPERSEQSVLDYELTGIQAPLDAIIGALPYRIERWESGRRPVRLVAVEWTDDMPPRIAFQRASGGCSLAPTGTQEDALSLEAPAPSDPAITIWSMKRPNALTPVLEGALGARYGAGTRTTAVSVNWRGDGGDHAYADGFTPFTPQRTWSVAKSIAATLIGANEYRGAGLIGLNAQHAAPPPPLAILEWYGGDGTDPRRAISMDHMLRMASGRYSDTPGNRTDPLYFGGSTVRETALHWPLVHEPGTVFRYANNDTLAAISAISATFGENPPAELFAKIGMADAVAETDWQGDYVLSSQVWASTLDLIRFGQLYLRDGVLPSGERVLPEGWVLYVRTPSGPQPEGEFGYGAGFWLMNKSPGVPRDTFAAFGNRGQYVVIVPSCDAVIVRRGEDPVGSRFDIAGFTRDVLTKLPCSQK